MWYNTQTNSFIKNNDLLIDIFIEIAEKYPEVFNPSDLINDYYPAFKMFNIDIYASEIIEKLRPDLWNELVQDQQISWALDQIDELDRYEEDYIEDYSIEDYLFTGFEELENIIWKEDIE